MHLINTLDGNTTGNIDGSNINALEGNGADTNNSIGISELNFDASNYLASHSDLLDTVQIQLQQQFIISIGDL